MSTQIGINFQSDDNERLKRKKDGTYEYKGRSISRSINTDPTVRKKTWDVSGSTQVFPTLESVVQYVDREERKQQRNEKLRQEAQIPVSEDDPGLERYSDNLFTYRDTFITKTKSGFRLPNDPQTYKSVFHATEQLDKRYNARKADAKRQTVSDPAQQIPVSDLNISFEEDDDPSAFKEEKKRRLDALMKQRRDVQFEFEQTKRARQMRFTADKDVIMSQMRDIRDKHAAARAGMYTVTSMLGLPGYAVSSVIDKATMTQQRDAELDALRQQLQNRIRLEKENNEALREALHAYRHIFHRNLSDIYHSTPKTGFRPNAVVPEYPKLYPWSNILDNVTSSVPLLPHYSYSSQRRIPFYGTASDRSTFNPTDGSQNWVFHPDFIDGKVVRTVSEASDSGMSFGPTVNTAGGGSGGGGPSSPRATSAPMPGGGKNWGTALLEGAAAIGPWAGLITAGIVFANKLDQVLTKTITNMTDSLTTGIRAVSGDNPWSPVKGYGATINKGIDALPMPDSQKAFIKAPIELGNAFVDNVEATLNRISKRKAFAPETFETSLNARLRLLDFDMNVSSEVDSASSNLTQGLSDIQIEMRSLQNELLVTLEPFITFVMIYLKLILKALTWILSWGRWAMKFQYPKLAAIYDLLQRSLGKKASASKVMEEADAFFRGK